MMIVFLITIVVFLVVLFNLIKSTKLNLNKKSLKVKKFVTFNQSPNELKNRLEQLRAIDNDIKINVALAKTSPIGVDTMEDFMAIKKIMEYKS